MDLEYAKRVDTSKFAKQIDLASWKYSEATPTDLSNLSVVAKNKNVKKTKYGELVKEVKTTNINNLVKKNEYSTKIAKIEKKLNHDHNNKNITTQEVNSRKLTVD